MKKINKLMMLLATLLTVSSCGNGVKPEGSSLLNTNWKLVNINGVSFLGKSPPTLRLEGKRASGFSGCNRYFSQYITSSKGTINFSSIASTKMLCRHPDSRNTEHQFIDGLRHAHSFTINNGQLTIKGSSAMLQFER